MRPLNDSIGKKIQELRTQAGLTQEAFADRAQMHRAHLGEIERGEVDISLSSLMKIAKGLGVTISTLTRGVRVTTRKASKHAGLSVKNQRTSSRLLTLSRQNKSAGNRRFCFCVELPTD